jgi:hypothetical protein
MTVVVVVLRRLPLRAGLADPRLIGPYVWIGDRADP